MSDAKISVSKKAIKYIENKLTRDMVLGIGTGSTVNYFISELSKFRGAAYDPVMNEFVSDLVNDQAVEIERMNILLTEISADPRAGLAGGLYHADEAILNLELVASLKKPVGFFKDVISCMFIIASSAINKPPAIATVESVDNLYENSKYQILNLMRTRKKKRNKNKINRPFKQ